MSSGSTGSVRGRKGSARRRLRASRALRARRPADRRSARCSPANPFIGLGSSLRSGAATMGLVPDTAKRRRARRGRRGARRRPLRLTGLLKVQRPAAGLRIAAAGTVSAKEKRDLRTGAVVMGRVASTGGGDRRWMRRSERSPGASLARCLDGHDAVFRDYVHDL